MLLNLFSVIWLQGPPWPPYKRRIYRSLHTMTTPEWPLLFPSSFIFSSVAVREICCGVVHVDRACVSYIVCVCQTEWPSMFNFLQNTHFVNRGPSQIPTRHFSRPVQGKVFNSLVLSLTYFSDQRTAVQPTNVLISLQ